MENEEAAEKIASNLHPPRCTECGREITYLLNLQDEWVVYSFRIDEKEDWGDYKKIDSWGGNFSEYKCPLCNEYLFSTEDDATSFLMGEEQHNLEEYYGEREGCSEGSRSITSAEMPTMWSGITLFRLFRIRTCEVSAPNSRDGCTQLVHNGTTG